jgi:hypothetical protein
MVSLESGRFTGSSWNASLRRSQEATYTNSPNARNPSARTYRYRPTNRGARRPGDGKRRTQYQRSARYRRWTNAVLVCCILSRSGVYSDEGRTSCGALAKHNPLNQRPGSAMHFRRSASNSGHSQRASACLKGAISGLMPCSGVASYSTASVAVAASDSILKGRGQLNG